MIQGENWIAWEREEAPALPGAEPPPKPVRERPVQEQQFGSNIDSMPIECNTPVPAGSGVAAQESTLKG